MPRIRKARPVRPGFMSAEDYLTSYHPVMEVGSPVKVLVPVSGGKDSQACLKLAVSQFSPRDVLGVFCDTMFEHPTTYEHVARLQALYGVQIIRLCAGSVEDKCLKYGRFPGGGARHCTDELKIAPAKKFYRDLAAAQGCGFEVWYGVRSDESPERSKRYHGKVCDELYAPHDFMSKYPEYLSDMGVMFRLAIVEWSYSEVMDFLGGEENPLYGQGFRRVGCFPCLAGGDASKENAFSHDDFGRAQYKIVQAISKKIGKSIWTSKGGISRNCQDGPGCSQCAI